jgi:hypothetical protein
VQEERRLSECRVWRMGNRALDSPLNQEGKGRMNATDECPDGDQCSIHNRVSGRRERDHDMQYVDYYGDYAVVTSFNPAASNPMMALLLSSYGVEKIPAPYDTHILLVGKRSIFEASELAGVYDGDPYVMVKWSEGYLKMNDAKGGHDMVVDALKAGILDLDAQASE